MRMAVLALRGSQRIKLALGLDQLVTQPQDNLNARQIHSKVVDQSFDKADLFDVGIAIVAEVTRAAAGCDQATSLIESQALLVHAA